MVHNCYNWRSQRRREFSIYPQKRPKTVSLEEVSRLTVNEAREVSLFFRKPLTRENNLNRKEPTNNDFRLLTSLQISQRKTSAKFSADFLRVQNCATPEKVLEPWLRSSNASH